MKTRKTIPLDQFVNYLAAEIVSDRKSADNMEKDVTVLNAASLTCARDYRATARKMELILIEVLKWKHADANHIFSFYTAEDMHYLSQSASCHAHAKAYQNEINSCYAEIRANEFNDYQNFKYPLPVC